MEQTQAKFKFKHQEEINIWAIFTRSTISCMCWILGGPLLSCWSCTVHSGGALDFTIFRWWPFHLMATQNPKKKLVETNGTYRLGVVYSGIVVGTLPWVLNHSTIPLVHHSSENGPLPLNVERNKDTFCYGAPKSSLNMYMKNLSKTNVE
jgi:hypothetical protein